MPVRVKQMEEHLEGIVADMIDRFIDKPQIEFRSEFAGIVPQAVLTDLLGMPRSDLPQLKRWTDAVIANQDHSTSEARKTAADIGRGSGRERVFSARRQRWETDDTKKK